MSGESLGPADLRRYNRQISLPSVGIPGQERLRDASVIIVGVGGLGSPAALYLAAAGVGRIGMIDPDRVDESNLHRQVLYETRDIGAPKVERAAERLKAMNPAITVREYDAALTSINALEVLREYDVVVDGTDTFDTRYLVNDACVLLGKPNVYASVLRFDGQLSVFGMPGGPCYRCLFPEPPPPGSVPSCAEAGVLGVLPGLMGTLQATETLKLLLATGESMTGRLLLVDGLRMQFRTIAVGRDPACLACGTREIASLGDYAAFCGRGAPEVDDIASITPVDFAERQRSGSRLELIDVREPFEYAIARIRGAQLMPMGKLPEMAFGLSPDVPVVVYCHHGSRSLVAARALRAAGFREVLNLTGGIDRYSREVDASVPRY